MAAGLQRIVKNLGAAVMARFLSIIPQVVLPAVFVHRYSTGAFGDWGALSGAVGALSALNFGLQTYMNQDLAVRFNRGEIEGYQQRQSTALRLLGGIVGTAAILGLIVFALPLQSWLHLDFPTFTAQLTLYLLGLQVLLNILLGYFAGIYLGVQRAHRGAYWNNFNTLLLAILLLTSVWFKLPFPVLAATQVAGLVISIVIVLTDLKRTAPILFPRVDYWDGKIAREILGPSGYFGLLSLSTFLVYQAPLVVLLRFNGPVAVAAFIVMRTLFSMCRQVLAMFTQSMQTEITTLFGRHEYAGLMKLYDLSERFVFFMIPLVNSGVLMLAPVLVTVWMHKRAELFSPFPYMLAAAVSMSVSLKEHKYTFQFATNTHEELARLIFGTYIAMSILSIGVVHWWGVVGFLWLWLATEVFQMSRIVGMNIKLFAVADKLTFGYLWKLIGICVTSLVLSQILLPRTSGLGLWLQVAIAVGFGAVVLGVSWPMFGMTEVFVQMKRRLRPQRS